ncbi:hypothetical protein PIB30_002565 [Stylosanthes scabra]|uniref:Uncharacterized protein n=1 Tax=Stylosanthes scabra TaxID=79078 RepID=A0ABU6Z278_9FABA|nr:hypothetical protein [Stylosanthes scabra]
MRPSASHGRCPNYVRPATLNPPVPVFYPVVLPYVDRPFPLLMIPIAVGFRLRHLFIIVVCSDARSINTSEETVAHSQEHSLLSKISIEGPISASSSRETYGDSHQDDPIEGSDSSDGSNSSDDLEIEEEKQEKLEKLEEEEERKQEIESQPWSIKHHV